MSQLVRFAPPGLPKKGSSPPFGGFRGQTWRIQGARKEQKKLIILDYL